MVDIRPDFTLTDQMRADLALIERVRSFFDSGMVPSTWLQEREGRALLAEAYHSSRLAGADVSLEQAERLLQSGPWPEAYTDGPREDLQVFADHVRTLAFVTGPAARVAVFDGSLIRTINAGLLQGARAGEGLAGRYREDGRSLAERVAKLATWLNEDRDVHPVLRAGLAVSGLSTIRPFVDGNRRTARALSLFCLCRTGYTFMRLLSMSEYYERDRAAYSEALRSADGEGGDVTPWLEYFTRGLVVQSIGLRERAGWVIRREALVDRYALSERQGQALGWVLQHGAITADEYQALVSETDRRSLQRDLKDMVEKRVLVPVPGAGGQAYRLRTAR